MTLYILVGIVAVVIGAVVSRHWTLRAVASLAKEAGVSGAMRDELVARETRREVADAKRRALAVRHLGARWRDHWLRRASGAD